MLTKMPPSSLTARNGFRNRHGFSLENLSDRPSGLQIERGSTHRNARQWFIPGHDIDRHVIVTDIQRYLGNDATVRPGRGTGENGGVPGY